MVYIKCNNVRIHARIYLRYTHVPAAHTTANTSTRLSPGGASAALSRKHLLHTSALPAVPVAAVVEARGVHTWADAPSPSSPPPGAWLPDCFSSLLHALKGGLAVATPPFSAEPSAVVNASIFLLYRDLSEEAPSYSYRWSILLHSFKLHSKLALFLRGVEMGAILSSLTYTLPFCRGNCGSAKFESSGWWQHVCLHWFCDFHYMNSPRIKSVLL